MNLLGKVFSIAIAIFSTASFAEVAVVVNKDNNNSIDNALIKRIYLGKVKSYPSGDKIKAIMLPNGSAETETFRTNALNKSSSQYKSYWSKLVFTGKGTPPKEAATMSEMLNMVKMDKNAIGFVASSAVTDDVKVITTFK